MKRSQGDGSVRTRTFKLADGSSYKRHFARIGVHNPLTSKTQYRDGPLRHTEAEAEEDRKQLAKRLEKGLLRPQSHISLAQYLDTWLERRKKDLTPKGWKEYELDVRLHIKPGLGRIKLDTLEALHIINWQDALNDKRGPWVAKKARSCLQSALTDAVYWQYIAQNPCFSVRGVRLPNTEANIWEPFECEAFLKVAKGTRYYLAYYLTLNLGLRIGELRALQWNDFSMMGGVTYLQVERQNTSDTSQPVYGPTKGKKHRVLDVTEDVLELLQQHKRAQDERRATLAEQWSDYNLLIATGHGTSVSSSRLRQAFYKLSKQAELPFLKLHELRHSAGSIWLARGMSLEQVSMRLGHSSIKVTEKIYIHQLKKAPQPFGMSMEKMLGKPALTPHPSDLAASLFQTQKTVKGEIKGEIHEKDSQAKTA